MYQPAAHELALLKHLRGRLPELVSDGFGGPVLKQLGNHLEVSGEVRNMQSLGRVDPGGGGGRGRRTGY